MAEGAIKKVPDKTEANGIQPTDKDDDEEEIIDISTHSRRILRRLAVLKPDRYTPRARSDMAGHVYTKTKEVRSLVAQQDRMVYDLKHLRNDIDDLELEVAQFQEEMWSKTAKRKYMACKEPADYVFKYDKYTLEDFV